MKKFTKVCLIAAAILILIGGTICVLGVFSGGWRMVDEMGMDSGFWRMMSRLGDPYGEYTVRERHHETETVEDVSEEMTEEILEGIKEGWEDSKDDIEAAREEMQKAGTEILNDIREDFLSDDRTEKGNTGIDAGQIREMKISIGGAGLCLLESEDDTFGVMIDGEEDYRYYESKGVFYLEGGKTHLTGNNERVYLYIPKDKNFDEVEIDVGGGVISIGELDAYEVELNAGAGVISSERITCRDLSVEVGAGEVVLQGIEADEVDVEVGMGSASLQGRVNREIDASCGMGYISLILDNAEADFNYEIECSAGAVNVGGRSYGAMRNDVQVNNKASGECSLECSMGCIDVMFMR